jgi:hypothetical protein
VTAPATTLTRLPGHDRQADQEAKLAALAGLLRERGQQRPPPEPGPIHRAPSPPERTTT